MGTTSSSSPTGSVLLISEPGGDGALFVPLRRAHRVAGSLEVFEYGAVVESRRYLISATLEGSGLVGATCTVNGGDEYAFEPAGGPLAADVGMVTVDFEAPSAQQRPFALVFGFARVEVEARYVDGSVARFVSQDIPCASSSEVRERDVRAMVKSLLDPASGGAHGWMFSSSAPALEAMGRHSVVEGGFRRRSARSLESYLRMTAAALDEFEERFSALRAQANTKVASTIEAVPASRIRRIGNQEVVWMSRHPEAMERTHARSAILYAGSYYRPRIVQTERAVRSFATYENCLLLSFLGAVIDDMGSIAANVDAAAADSGRLTSQLRRLEVAGQKLGALVVAEAYAERAARLAPIVARLRSRAQRLARMYGAALPDATPGRMASPRRTRVFQEIEPYARLFEAMRHWWEDGEYALGQEGLALNLVRSDRLFELYTLFRMLDWFERHGFGPRVGADPPFEEAAYTVGGERFEAGARVANVYRLGSPDCSVDLYYEPVLHGGMLEENGVTLHRTTGWREDPVYTPDFVVSVTWRNGPPKRTFMLDAKYSDAVALRRAGRDGEGAVAASEFENCQRKYLLEVVDASTGRRPDALWLLAGKGSADEFWTNEMSPWARARMRGGGQASGFASGIAPVTPRNANLDMLFAAMGFGGEVSGSAWGEGRNRQAPATRAEAQHGSSGETGTIGAERSNALGQAKRVPDGIPTTTPRNPVAQAGEDRDEPQRVVDAFAVKAELASEDVPVKERPTEDAKVETTGSVAPDDAEAVEAQEPLTANHSDSRESADEGPADGESLVEERPRKRKKKKVEQRKPKVRHGSKKHDKGGGAASKPSAGPKRHGIDEDVLADVLELCRDTLETSALFGAESARRQLGIMSGPLLRRSLPKGDAKRYRLVEVELRGGEKEELYVYSAWKPPQVRMLKTTLERMRKEAAQAKES